MGSVGQARLKSHEPTARGPSRHTARVRASPSSRACKNLLQPSPLWLGFIVAWLVLQVCSVGICSMFNCPFVQLIQVQLSHVSVCSSSIDLVFNLFRFNLYQCSNDFVRLTCYLPSRTHPFQSSSERTHHESKWTFYNVQQNSIKR